MPSTNSFFDLGFYNTSVILFENSLTQEYIKIREYLNYENNGIDDGSNMFEFIYYVPNMKINRPRITELTDIKNYKNDIINNTYENIETVFKNIINLDNSKAEYIKNKIKQSIDEIKSLQNDLEIGLSIREEALKNLNFTKNIEDLFENKNNINVNLIHNTIFNKIYNSNLENSLYFNSGTKTIFNFDKNQNSIRKNLSINNEKLTNYLLINFDQNSVNNIDLDENGLIIQLFVNMARSIVSLMPNCLIKNDIEDTISFNFKENNNYINVINESLNNKLWENINFNDFDYKTYFSQSKNYLKNLKNAYKEMTYFIDGTGIYENVKNINENDINRISDQIRKISNYNSSDDVSFIGINKLFEYINTTTIGTENYNLNEGLIFNHPANEIEKLFSGNYYNSNLKTYSNDENSVFKFHIASDNYSISSQETITNVTSENESLIFTGVGIDIVDENGNYVRTIYPDTQTEDFTTETLRNPAYNTTTFNTYGLLNFIYNKNNQPGIENFVKLLIDKAVDNNLVDNYYEKIYINKKPLYKFTDNRRLTNNTAPIVQNEPADVNFEFDLNSLNLSSKNIDSNYVSLKINNIISQIKIQNLNKLDIDMTLFHEIISNIKRSENKNVLLSFSKDDDESISVVNKNTELFKLLFTESDNIDDSNFNSNFSLNTDIKVHKVRFKNILHNIENSFSNEKTINNLFNLISNYYPDTCFITPSYFLKNIISDIKSHTENITVDKYEISDFISQALYCNYFNEKNNDLLENSLEVKKLIAKRFIKNAIKNDAITASSVKSSELKEFVYDNKIYSSDDVDFTNPKFAEKTLDKFYNSSPALSIISSSIFGKDNIDSLSRSYRYSQVLLFTKNLLNVRDLYYAHEYSLLEKIGINFNSNEQLTYELSSKITDLLFESIVSTNILPFMHLLDTNYISTKKVNDIHDYNIFPLKREMYNSTENSWQFLETKKVSRKDISFDLFVTTSEEDESIVIKKSKSKDLSEDEENKYQNFQKIFITDSFDKLCNRKNDIFNSIINKIQILLRVCVKDYLSNKVEKEQDIDKIINDNENIINLVIEIIESYAIFYDNILERLCLNNSLSSFTNYSQIFDLNKIRGKIYNYENKTNRYFMLLDTFKYSINRSEILGNLKIAQSDEFFNSLNYNIDSNFIIADYTKLLEKYNKNYETFVLDNVNLRASNLMQQASNTSFTRDDYNLNSNLGLQIEDTINIFNQQDEDLEDSIRRASVSSTEDQFIKKTYDMFYTLVTSESFEMLNLDLIRTFLILLENIKTSKNNIYNQSLLSVSNYLNIEENIFFDKINNFYFQNMFQKNMTKCLIKNNKTYNEVYSKISSQNIIEFFENNNTFDYFKNTRNYNNFLENLNKREIFALNIKYDNIKNLKNNSFIKITLLPKDMCDNNKIYLPKTFIFSLNLSNIHTKMANEITNESEVLFFEKDKRTRFSKANIVSDQRFSGLASALRELSDGYFNNLISSDSTLFDQFSKDIYNNHKISSELNDTISLLLGINLYDNTYSNSEAETFVQNISDEDFQQIFKEGKQEFISKLYNNVYTLPREFNKCFSNLVSNNMKISDEVYDTYIFDIDLYDLPFYYKRNVTEGDNFKEYSFTPRKLRDLYFEKINASNIEKLYVDTWKSLSQNQVNQTQESDTDDVDKLVTINFSIKVETI